MNVLEKMIIFFVISTGTTAKTYAHLTEQNLEFMCKKIKTASMFYLSEYGSEAGNYCQELYGFKFLKMFPGLNFLKNDLQYTAEQLWVRPE